MRRKALLYGFPLVIAGILTLPTLLSAQKVASHVRVVRLSYVSGVVGVKRPASSEWARAQVNTPIQEGFEVSTAAHSYAEVEFENGSTARLGEYSQLSFDQLAMDADGNKLNRLTFENGYATFHLLPEHHDEYTVQVADSTLAPNGKSEFRTDLDHGKVRVEVFAGSVELTTASKKMRLGKDKVLEFNPGATEVAMNVREGIAKDSWDKWAESRDTQAQLSLNDQAVAPGGGYYGWSDLGAYGEWGFFPGFGYGWSPFVGAGWSPYNMGMWSFYPGMGYTWISSEPWGWLPYHYGSWNFSAGFGWFWMPGSFDEFSPALVSWYSGPGWIGWAPLGAIGPVGQGIVTTVPVGVLQNGVAVNPAGLSHMPVKNGTRIAHVTLQPGAGALLSGTRLSAETMSAFTTGAAALHATAPDSILLGGSAATENAPQGGHASRQPLQVRLGNTLGGAYTLHGSTGEFRGNALVGTPGAKGAREPDFAPNAGGPTLLPHGQQVARMSFTGGGGGIIQTQSAPAPSSSGNATGSTPAMSAPSAGAGGGGGHVAGSGASGGHH